MSSSREIVQEVPTDYVMPPSVEQLDDGVVEEVRTAVAEKVDRLFFKLDLRLKALREDSGKMNAPIGAMYLDLLEQSLARLSAHFVDGLLLTTNKQDDDLLKVSPNVRKEDFEELARFQGVLNILERAVEAKKRTSDKLSDLKDEISAQNKEIADFRQQVSGFVDLDARELTEDQRVELRDLESANEVLKEMELARRKVNKYERRLRELYERHFSDLESTESLGLSEAFELLGKFVDDMKQDAAFENPDQYLERADLSALFDVLVRFEREAPPQESLRHVAQRLQEHDFEPPKGVSRKVATLWKRAAIRFAILGAILTGVAVRDCDDGRKTDKDAVAEMQFARGLKPESAHRVEGSHTYYEIPGATSAVIFYDVNDKMSVQQAFDIMVTGCLSQASAYFSVKGDMPLSEEVLSGKGYLPMVERHTPIYRGAELECFTWLRNFEETELSVSDGKRTLERSADVVIAISLVDPVSNFVYEKGSASHTVKEKVVIPALEVDGEKLTETQQYLVRAAEDFVKERMGDAVSLFKSLDTDSMSKKELYDLILGDRTIDFPEPWKVDFNFKGKTYAVEIEVKNFRNLLGSGRRTVDTKTDRRNTNVADFKPHYLRSARLKIKVPGREKPIEIEISQHYDEKFEDILRGIYGEGFHLE